MGCPRALEQPLSFAPCLPAPLSHPRLLCWFSSRPVPKRRPRSWPQSRAHQGASVQPLIYQPQQARSLPQT
eukprot:3236089-Pleurochrysis_carterae.AAC.1